MRHLCNPRVHRVSFRSKIDQLTIEKHKSTPCRAIQDGRGERLAISVEAAGIAKAFDVLDWYSFNANRSNLSRGCVKEILY